MQFYILAGNQRKGPFTVEQLLGEGLERDSLVWHTGLADWVRADQVPALGDLMLAIPPPVPGASPLPPEGPLFAAAWVRYSPSTFKAVYTWFVVLACLSLVLTVVGIVLLLVADQQYSQLWGLRGQVRIFELARQERDLSLQQQIQTLRLLTVGAFVAAALALVTAVALFFVLFYKAWNQIQDGHVRTSAERAIGFLFIPGFNLYWLFVAVYGLAWELHHYVVRRRLFGRHGLSPYPVSPGLALVCCIVMVCNVVPVVDFVTIPISLILLMVLLAAVKNASMGIATERQSRAPTWSPERVSSPAEIPSEPVGIPADVKSEQVRRLETE